MYKIGRFYTAHCFLFVSIACFALGLTAHAFAFTNLFPTHDSLYNQYFDTLEYLHQISLGRFCLPVYVELTASVATLPFSVGVISLLYLSIFSYIIVKCFNLNLLTAISVCGIVVTNRTIIALTATYMPWLGADCLAVLLAGIAFSFWLKILQIKTFKFMEAPDRFRHLSLLNSFSLSSNDFGLPCSCCLPMLERFNRGQECKDCIFLRLSCSPNLPYCRVYLFLHV